MFKSVLMSGTAVLLAFPVLAADILSGDPVRRSWDAFVSGAVGQTWYDIEEGTYADHQETDGLTTSLRGSAAFQSAVGFGVEGDVTFDHQGFAHPWTPYDDEDASSADGALHLFYRSSDSFLLGAFGQFGKSEYDREIVPDIDVDRFYGGGEAQLYFGNATLYMQGGFQHLDFMSDDFDDIQAEGAFVSIEGRYFLTPDLKVSIRAGYSGFEVDAHDSTFDTFTIGAGVEHRFQSLPLSVFADIEYLDFGLDLPDGYEENGEVVRLLAGVKLNFGAATLQERDRAGASLDPVRYEALSSLAGAIIQPPPP